MNLTAFKNKISTFINRNDSDNDEKKPFWKKDWFIVALIALSITWYYYFSSNTKQDNTDESKKIERKYDYQIPVQSFEKFANDNSWSIIKITQPENTFVSYFEVVVDDSKSKIVWIELSDTWSTSDKKSLKNVKVYKNINQEWKDVNVDFNKYSDKIGIWFYDSSEDTKKTLDLVGSWMNIFFTLLFIVVLAISFGRMSWVMWSVDIKKISFKKSADWSSAFDEIGGIQAQKEELNEVVQNLRDWKKFDEEGVRKMRGIMFFWPSWVGKTMIAKAIARDWGIDFFSVTWGDFRSAYLGQSAKNVKKSIKYVKDFVAKHKKDLWILFIDEIDTVLKKRNTWHSEDSTVVNAFLAEMDGIEGHSNVLIIGASNYSPEELDSAAMSRFDKKLYFNLPTLDERVDIINKLLAYYKKSDAKDRIDMDSIDVNSLAQKMVGASGRDIDNVINEARRKSVSKDIKITNELLHEEYAIFRIGPNHGGIVMDEEEKSGTAYHELWHAYVAKFVWKNPETTTIIPRWPALGITWILETKDKFSYSEEDMLNEIRYLLWGRMAEKHFIWHVGTGASNDYMRANKLAVDYFIKYDFSYDGERLGVIAESLDKLSATNRTKIDDLTKRIIMEQEAYVLSEILQKHEDNIRKSYKLLMEKETIHKDDIYL